MRDRRWTPQLLELWKQAAQAAEAAHRAADAALVAADEADRALLVVRAAAEEHGLALDRDGSTDPPGGHAGDDRPDRPGGISSSDAG